MDGPGSGSRPDHAASDPTTVVAHTPHTLTTKNELPWARLA